MLRGVCLPAWDVVVVVGRPQAHPGLFKADTSSCIPQLTPQSEFFSAYREEFYERRLLALHQFTRERSQGRLTFERRHESG